MKQMQMAVLSLMMGISAATWAQIDLPKEAQSLNQDQQILHVLNRLGYGPTPESVAHVKKIGVAAYIDEQLHPASIAESPLLINQLKRFSTISTSQSQLIRQNLSYQQDIPEAQQDDAMMKQGALKQRQQLARQILFEAQSARLDRAISSQRQLEAALIDFWFNHFNVYQKGGINGIVIGAYERDAIAPYVLGHFDQLLLSTARSVAMSNYLNNRVSTKAMIKKDGKVQGLNENYAREVMELHTLGVNGGYTQKDVTELARILTGWAYDASGQADPSANDLFVFKANRHDTGTKVFLGQTFNNDGVKEGERALQMLANHPKTAQFISQKLAEYFVSDQPPQALVNRMSQRFLATRGDIQAVMQTLVTSPEFWSTASVGKKFKTPYQYVVSSMRVGGVTPSNDMPLIQTLNRLNMPLYGYLTPEGYKQIRSAWLSPTAMSARIDFATAFARGSLPLMGTDKPTTEQQKQLSTPDPKRIQNLLTPLLQPQTLSTVQQAPQPLKAALLLSSPEFMAR